MGSWVHGFMGSWVHGFMGSWFMVHGHGHDHVHGHFSVVHFPFAFSFMLSTFTFTFTFTFMFMFTSMFHNKEIGQNKTWTRSRTQKRHWAQISGCFGQDTIFKCKMSDIWCSDIGLVRYRSSRISDWALTFSKRNNNVNIGVETRWSRLTLQSSNILTVCNYMAFYTRSFYTNFITVYRY